MTLWSRWRCLPREPPSGLGSSCSGSKDRSPDTFPVPLSSVASYELAGGTGSVRHIDQDLVVTIEGDIRTGFNQNAVRAQAQELIDHAEPGEGHYLRMGGADDEQRQAQEFLSRAFSIALVLILGAGHSVRLSGRTGHHHGQCDSLAGGCALGPDHHRNVLWRDHDRHRVISLAGVVVNNAIVLLDYGSASGTAVLRREMRSSRRGSSVSAR